jgi:hypothetical protein
MRIPRSRSLRLPELLGGRVPDCRDRSDVSRVPIVTIRAAGEPDHLEEEMHALEDFRRTRLWEIAYMRRMT